MTNPFGGAKLHTLPLRIEFPGALYHITSRGNAQQPVFQDDRDRHNILQVLSLVVERFDWLCPAYCLNVLQAVRKTLGLIETNLRHSSLNTHEFTSLKGPNGEKVFEAYAQQRTSAAYRISWDYGPGRKQITIVAITSQP